MMERGLTVGRGGLRGEEQRQKIGITIIVHTMKKFKLKLWGRKGAKYNE